MPDIFTKAKRSEVMARIRGRGNRDTELRMIAVMREHGITGWRRNRRVFGKPDFVFPKHKLAVFVDGCFWHGCPRCYRRPRSNLKYWDAKILRNRVRDRLVRKALKKSGWRVVRVWAHELDSPRRCIRKLYSSAAQPIRTISGTHSVRPRGRHP